MYLKKSLISNIIVAFLVSTSVVILSEADFLERLQLGGLDLLFHLRGLISTSPHIIIIEIDDKNISKIGRWPWSRRYHAAMAMALKELGAKNIYFDILFPESASEEEDDVFSQAIEEAENVYLPFAFQERTADMKNALLPIENLSSHAKGTGLINIYPDRDGVLRKIPLFFEDKDTLYYHIALRMAMDYRGLKFERIRNGDLILYNTEGRIKIPLVDDNEMLISWLGKWKDTFRHYSFLDVLNAYQDVLEGRKPKIDVEPFKDSISLVAVTAIGLYDIISVPLEPEYPAIGVMATTINNILDRQFIKTAPVWTSWLLIWILALIPSLLITGERVTRETLLTILVGAVFISTDFLLFKKNLWIDPSLPLASMSLSYLTISIYNFIIISTEKKAFFKLAVTDGLTQLSNIRYFKIILRTECIAAKTEFGKHFCIVMIDIDHFKRVNDTYGHRVGDLVLREVAAVLNKAVRASDVVARYGGEEMIVLLRGAPLESALDVAEELRKKVENHKISDEKNTYNITISLGVSSSKFDDDEEAIIQRADEALYKAKNSGRNRVETIEKSSHPAG